MGKSDVRICFIGDSFVSGTGDPEFLGWTGRLCAASLHAGLGLTHYNLGIRRDTSADIRQRWQAETAARLPNYSDNRIVFSFGVNDTTYVDGKSRVTLAASVANARAILTTAQQQYPVLMIGPLPIDDVAQNQRSEQLNAAFALLCDELSIPYLSVFRPMLNSKVWLREVKQNDGAHPLAGGYAALANAVDTWDAWWF